VERASSEASLVKADLGGGGSDPPGDVLLGNAPVPGREGEFIADRLGEELLFGVLEHQADLPADVPEVRTFFLHLKPVDEYFPLHGQKNPVEVLGEGRFAASRMAHHGEPCACGKLEGDVPEGAGFEGRSRVVGVAEARNDYRHSASAMAATVGTGGTERPSALRSRQKDTRGGMSSPHSRKGRSERKRSETVPSQAISPL